MLQATAAVLCVHMHAMIIIVRRLPCVHAPANGTCPHLLQDDSCTLLEVWLHLQHLAVHCCLERASWVLCAGVVPQMLPVRLLITSKPGKLCGCMLPSKAGPCTYADVARAAAITDELADVQMDDDAGAPGCLTWRTATASPSVLPVRLVMMATSCSRAASVSGVPWGLTPGLLAWHFYPASSGWAATLCCAGIRYGIR